MRRESIKNKGGDFIGTVAVFGIVTIITAVVITAVISALVTNGKMSEDRAETLIPIAALIGGIAGGIGGRLKLKGEKLKLTMLIALTAAIIKTVISFLLPEGRGDPSGYLSLAAIIAGGAIAGLIPVGQAKRRRKR